MYDPLTGSYLTPDPLGLAPAPNPHAYVTDPLLQIDPLGLDPGIVERGAPTFRANSSGIVDDMRGLGRPDNQLVLSGHGALEEGDGSFTTVPPGSGDMTWYPDLSSYSYEQEFMPAGQVILNVGWLDPKHDFPAGDPLILAAPTLVAHYVQRHRYLPPPEFIEAVLACRVAPDPDA